MKISKNCTLWKILKCIQTTGNLFRLRALSAHSGQTAFFLILSFFPFLLFLFAMLRLTPLTEEMFASLLLEIFPSAFRQFIGKLIHNIYTTGNRSVLSISIVSSIWLGSKAFLSLIQGLNSMYQSTESRNYFVIRISAFLYSILFAFLILVILTIFVFGNQIHLSLFKNTGFLDGIFVRLFNFRLLLGFFILFAIFLFLYCILPNCKWKIKWHIPGAALTTISWLTFSYLYSFYVDSISHYSSFYGAMTTIALLMIWLYACMYILFLGGILNECLHRKLVINNSTNS